MCDEFIFALSRAVRMGEGAHACKLALQARKQGAGEGSWMKL